MKKWFKKAIIGLSAVGVCTIVPLAVVSCSSSTQQSNNSTNNSSNKNSNSANGNTSTEVSYVPYSKLTTTITKEANFQNALANWTQSWNTLTNTQAKFQQVVTNDVNAFLNWYAKLQNTNFNSKYSFKLNNNELAINSKVSNITVNSFNKDISSKMINLSFTYTQNFSFDINGTIYQNVFSRIQNVSFKNASITPCLSFIANNPIYESTASYTNENLYGGWYISKCSIYSNSISLTELNSKYSNISYIDHLYNIFQNQNSSESYTPNIQNEPYPASNVAGIDESNTFCAISSFNKGINYGNLKVANTNN